MCFILSYICVVARGKVSERNGPTLILMGGGSRSGPIEIKP